MSAVTLNERKSIDRLVFEHYLRTGEQLTHRHWRARHERKFNPYHDAIGRFSTASNATTAGIRAVPPALPKAPSAPRTLRGGQQPGKQGISTSTDGSRESAIGPKQNVRAASNGFRSSFVLDRIETQTSNADSYFELNKRQAQLDRLRQDAGPSPHPTVKADLDEFQRRLDANRGLLNERYKVAEREVTEIVRAGLAPIDIAAGATNIASGAGELRDFLAVAGAIPIGAAAGKIGGLLGRTTRAAGTAQPAAEAIVQLGGAHKVVRRLKGHHSHHMPADSISHVRRSEGPSIAMTAVDHEKTASYGNWAVAKRYREAQERLIKEGRFSDAQNMDIADVRKLFGSKYDDAIEQMLQYTRTKGIK